MDVEVRYFLGKITLEAHNRLEIKQDEYISLLLAKKTLGMALSIEEKYDVALCNYLDFEKEQLEFTLGNLVNSVNYDYDYGYRVLSTLNRKLINFLSTARQYTEMVPVLASKCSVNDSETMTKVKGLLREHYDEFLDYRAMDALRNHVNHCGLAVHTISTPSKWTLTEQKDVDQLVFNLEIYSEKAILAENSGFKKKTLAELPEKYDLKKGARTYIGSISHVHEKVRGLISGSVSAARKTMEQHLESYAKINDGDSFAVGAFIEKNNEQIAPLSIISLSWDDVRVNLQNKNISVSNMNKRYLTNAIVK